LSCNGETNTYFDETVGRVSDEGFYIFQFWMMISDPGEHVQKLGGELAYKNPANYSPKHLEEIEWRVLKEGEEFPRTYVDDAYRE